MNDQKSWDAKFEYEHRNRVRAMRCGMRKLCDGDPEAFGVTLRELHNAGEHWQSCLPPIKTGKGTKPLAVDDMTLIPLLANYRDACAAGLTREAFLATCETHPVRFGNEYAGGEWAKVDAMAKHLNAAVNRASNDPQFGEAVEMWRRYFGRLRAP